MIITQCEHTKWIPEIERQITYDITYMWNLNYDTNESIYKTETDSRDREQTCGCQEEQWGRDELGVWCSVQFSLVAQSCPTLCDPIDGSPPGSPVPGILQARTLEWVAISFSSAWKGKVKVKSLSHIWLSATPWTAAYQAPPSTGFSRQEYWSGSPLPSPTELWGRP